MNSERRADLACVLRAELSGKLIGMELTIKTPRDFNYRRTVLSHGWCALEPFELDQKSWTLMRVLDLAEAEPVTVEITSRQRTIRIRVSRRVGKKAAAEIERAVRHMFRLDDDLSEFYRATTADPDFAWIEQEGAGRLLRSPTVFEDLVKMICTTNCSWALTEKMVSGLVKHLGRESAGGRKSFPSAAVMAAQSPEFFRDQIRAGYRAPYLAELSQRVASGSLDVEAWLTSELPLGDLIKEMKSVKGVGNYAAENLLKLIGRYDGLALDSWTRAQFARLRNQGRVAGDKKILRFYSRFQTWRGLALWCDLTREWIKNLKIMKKIIEMFKTLDGSTTSKTLLEIKCQRKVKIETATFLPALSLTRKQSEKSSSARGVKISLDHITGRTER